MKAQMKIETVTKELVGLYGFEDIKVKLICEKAGVSRKTFYTFYKDKYDVIESIFYNDIFLYSLKLYELFGDVRNVTPLVLEKIYQKYYDDKPFYTNAFKITGNHSFEESIVYHLNIFNQKLLEKQSINSYEKEFISYYFSGSQTIILKKWIKDGMVMSPKELSKLHQQLVNDSFLKNYFS